MAHGHVVEFLHRSEPRTSCRPILAIKLLVGEPISDDAFFVKHLDDIVCPSLPSIHRQNLNRVLFERHLKCVAAKSLLPINLTLLRFVEERFNEPLRFIQRHCGPPDLSSMSS